MHYQVFVQNQPDNTYSATVIGLPDCTVEGETKEEVVAKAKAAFEARFSRGEVITLEYNPPPSEAKSHPWLKYLGVFADDPTFDDFTEKLAAIRREANEARDE